MSDTDGTSKTPDQIRAEIDATRSELGTNVDALADKVNPTQIAHRQADKVKSRFSGVRETVMGSVHDKKASAGTGADAVKDAGQQAADKVKGNPLAVGLVAFGAGWLISSLIPASDKEKDLAGQVKEKAAPLVDQAKSAAQDVAQNLKGPAQDAIGSVKNTAQDAVGAVKDEAQSSASDVKDTAQAAKDDVQSS
ncbi:uncharacterized protein DUF3618 [Frondihabitans sp. PhB188]|uniref:DUF3618 domain-containing protein n=1 Tax=Frondihabitans sp. PhB188 TaxID=2485200 RepID=UPI000F4A19A6|nr:DUF3618 domain-containing protein [Frondihabitans sp. PhB188]ROQ37136.1 uncharacterized protein DUF3618 [Frondihabitans sp. PhB188]